MNLRSFRAVTGMLMASVLIIWGTCLAPASVQAQEAAESSTRDAAAESTGATPDSLIAEDVLPDSPRRSVTDFLRMTRELDYAGAARYLDTEATGGQAERQAKRLKAVLDRHLWIDLDQISPRSEGDVQDGLPPGTDEIGTIAGPSGRDEPVRVVRKEDDEGGRWVFSAATVGRIDAWYQTLGNQWLLENLPEPLLRPGPRDLLWWQWVALPLILLISWFIGFFLSGMSKAFLARLASRTETQWDDAILSRIGGPLTMAWSLVLFGLLLPWLELYKPAEDFINGVLRTGFYLVFFWAILRTVDIVAQVLLDSPWAQAHPASRSLVPIGARVAKVAVAGIAVVAVISELGFPVASLVAGLGIGGLALALAAQKTVENLFGSFSIGVDQPFREGDTVRVEDFVGQVEAIGLRSTRFRTLDRTLISIPNGKLADSRLESLTARDRLRFFTILGLEYGTTAEQMRTVLAGLEKTLREHPKIWSESLTVRFEEFAGSSLNIKVQAWFETQNFDEFQEIRQEILLKFMEVVEGAGCSFAFPTQTIHLKKDGG